jgi:hypothetical protein
MQRRPLTPSYNSGCFEAVVADPVVVVVVTTS